MQYVWRFVIGESGSRDPIRSRRAGADVGWFHIAAASSNCFGPDSDGSIGNRRLRSNHNKELTVDAYSGNFPTARNSRQ